ncbi:hypothetical protein TPELB_23880 [Terrisporobacter petrolearius]|uniref:HTH cro/C1-type domain-containing protein n=1 Tax=Terrisporobacter petrolearius TaxID=1460447 RepID=A0ABZ3FE22_9FIRM
MNSLVDFRVSNNLTQKQMADKLGTTLSYYSKVELGKRNPSYNFLIKFKSTFSEVNIDKLFFTN